MLKLGVKDPDIKLEDIQEALKGDTNELCRDFVEMVVKLKWKNGHLREFATEILNKINEERNG